MKLILGLILAVVSCEQLNDRIQFISGSYQPQSGGAAGMGITEHYNLKFKVKDSTLLLDSAFTKHAASKIYDRKYFKDTLYVQFTFNYPGVSQPHPPEGITKILSNNELLFIGRDNQNPLKVLIKKDQLNVKKLQQYK